MSPYTLELTAVAPKSRDCLGPRRVFSCPRLLLTASLFSLHLLLLCMVDPLCVPMGLGQHSARTWDGLFACTLPGLKGGGVLVARK